MKVTKTRLVVSGTLQRRSVSGSKSRITFASQFALLTISSLKNHGVYQEVDEMFELGREAMSLPSQLKYNFEVGNEGGQFGYGICSTIGTQLLIPAAVSRP